MAEEKKEKNRWVDAVTRMIELTQQGKLIWSVEYIPAPDDGDRTMVAFLARYKDKLIRLYKGRIRLEYDDLARVRETMFPSPTWATKIVLEFVNTDGETLWTFPEVEALSDLLSAVQYQVAGVGDFLDEIFNDAEVSV
jgi:hypothetical protein